MSTNTSHQLASISLFVFLDSVNDARMYELLQHGRVHGLSLNKELRLGMQTEHKAAGKGKLQLGVVAGAAEEEMRSDYERRMRNEHDGIQLTQTSRSR